MPTDHAATETPLAAEEAPVALITGAGRRIGAAIARHLHAHGYRLLLHYRQSAEECLALAEELNGQRPDTALCLQADLANDEALATFADATLTAFGRLDVLINNASSFYPTPIGQATLAQWDDLMSSNAKAPFFLSQALKDVLKQQRGAIINIADIHARQPLREYTIYCMAKAANVMLTQSLAKELAPEVRVNGVAPGAILWPEKQGPDKQGPGHGSDDHGASQEAGLDEAGKASILGKIPLSRAGQPKHIAETVLFLIRNDYITGQIVPVDGGRSIN